jgi:site-specific DNA-methyltransferase (adenine-specific)
MKLMMTNLFCGDNVEVLRREVADNSIQLTVTSPPYDNLRKYNGFTWDFEGVASELYRVTKPGGVVVWVVADATVNGSETGTSFRQALYFKECGFNLHDTMIYQKACYVPLTHNRYEQSFEYMFVFSKGRPSTFNAIRIACLNPGAKKYRGNAKQKEATYSERRREETTVTNTTKQAPNIFTYAVGTNDKTPHNAPFPESLARDHILSWSSPGDIVLDPFLGGGTTGKMAFQLGRFFIGCDISPEYVEIARNRIGGSLDDWGITPGGGQDVWSNCKT